MHGEYSIGYRQNTSFKITNQIHICYDRIETKIETLRLIYFNLVVVCIELSSFVSPNINVLY
jgi:hypothetical protein